MRWGLSDSTTQELQSHTSELERLTFEARAALGLAAARWMRLVDACSGDFEQAKRVLLELDRAERPRQPCPWVES